MNGTTNLVHLVQRYNFLRGKSLHDPPLDQKSDCRRQVDLWKCRYRICFVHIYHICVSVGINHNGCQVGFRILLFHLECAIYFGIILRNWVWVQL